MKKASLYLLALIGALSILLFLFHSFTGSTGATLYGDNSIASPVQANYDTNSNPAAMGSSSTTNSPSESAMRRMIIRNASITLQVNNINQAIEKITQLADRSGGYVVSSNINQNSLTDGNSYADISIRVPAKGLNNALNELKTFANKTLDESVSGEDITQQYVDLKSQLGNLQKSKEQLEKIMLGAKKTEDVLKVFKQLSATQGQIDVLEGQIKYYNDSVAFSLISIVLKMNPAILSEQEKQWQLGEVFTSSYHDLVNGLRHFTYGFIQFVVYFLPFIVLWGFISFIVYWVGRKIYILIRR